MSAIIDLPAHTLAKQRAASDPAASAWVSANAGSGKTHVLIQRVVRLLLEGTAPSKILCLTFTKAAAANMASRVFEMLALWTRLSDEDLREAIIATGAPAPTGVALDAARTLFARTVETPGGLKIQTIHAFCEMLLHLFPFEANVAARFEVADEPRQAELLARARREVLAGVSGDPRGLGAHIARLVDECSPADFEALIKEAMAFRGLRELWDKDPEQDLRKALHLAAGRDGAAVERDIIENGLSPALWPDVAHWLDHGGSTDQKLAKQFRDAAAAREIAAGRASQGDLLFCSQDCVAAYLAIFFIDAGEGHARSSLATKKPAALRPDLAAMLYAEQARLEPLRIERRSAATLSRTLALLGAVQAVFTRYHAIKAARGILDFDDLVERALALVERSDAAWVLYKLDAGIDHILVDEAQDTSAPQWRILERLTGDFAGAGRGGRPRTFFAVGDEKQSIFSFQGAAPEMFAQMLRRFRVKFSAGEAAFEHVRLGLSFRSSPGILSAVDQVFEHGEHQSGLIADDDLWMPHEALKRYLPGLVEIWPPVGPEAREDPRDWKLPLDIRDSQDPVALVADRVARKIALLIAETGETVFDTRDRRPRAIRAGDILILVRRRGPLFEALIRALKNCNVPVAGADRLELADHIAIMDLVAAGRTALLPQDDLTLACVLKSPLIGLDDDDLLAFAPNRSGSLFDALAHSGEPRHTRAFARIAAWRARAAQSPFAFYSSLLCEDGGRLAFAARLGAEAADAVDEFLRLALSHDNESAPSLVAFLDTFENMECSIKRDMETGADAVRVMTVHAAKGLEAKIVFLPDTCGAPTHRHDPKLFKLSSGRDDQPLLAWSPKSALDCPATAEARTRARAAALEEYRRLLYVALTRAEERLYIAGCHGAKGPSPQCWATMILATLGQGGDFESFPAFWNIDDKILRRASGSSASTSIDSPPPPAPPVAAPDWLARPAFEEARDAPLVRPSGALASRSGFISGSDAPPATTARRLAMEQGRLAHLLLQYLPGLAPDLRRTAALNYLAAAAGGLGAAWRQALADKIIAVLDLPALKDLFSPGSIAEAPLEGAVALPGGRKIAVAGQVDRIAETPEAVLVADFKTRGGAAGGVPASYIAQMALYRAVLAPLWPGKPLRMSLVWIDDASVVELETGALDAALASIETD
ncbi:double-strand break repair helicase AddA [Methylocapsa palsarum]|uniref:DNA 3'-5' helicase n=1 Tax=Methylocapsa palsarum TaxID=1612308 RepID=A0A1I3ZUF9_9HYPH|nr:double-strand break repair helicase AddA [Methylocapsa palsarum]SFK47725.1 DNA helicase/exodeoxyribonuclease V, subunit A [Methylocapsa palsarum]